MTHAKLQVGTTLERATSAQYAARCPHCGWTQPARSLAGAGLAMVAHYLEFPSHGAPPRLTGPAEPTERAGVSFWPKQAARGRECRGGRRAGAPRGVERQPPISIGPKGGR
jgi:hypothetical protein